MPQGEGCLREEGKEEEEREKNNVHAGLKSLPFFGCIFPIVPHAWEFPRS